MKKRKSRSPRHASAVSKRQERDTRAAPSRRSVLNTLSWIGLASAVTGGGVLLSARAVRARRIEGDLSRVGKGVPSVVQVHDPTCQSCAALQKQARRAMRDFNDDTLIFVVADQTTPQGREFAQRFGARHVTLVLLDGDGAYVDTLQGVRAADALRPVFAELAQ